VRNFDFGSLPPILGYNQVRPRPEGHVIAQWQGTTDPLLAVAEIGLGRTVAYTSDPAPHWGCNFVFWDHYNRFWLNILDWLTAPRNNSGTTR
jgi:uncharacterized membrane protein